MSLRRDELNRYSQQLNLNEIGLAGQLKLKNARVLCIGAGGLGSSLLLYLAAAGIGTLGIVDHDAVELSNLHRQVLYRTSDIGHKKAFIAKQQLFALNPEIEINTYTEKLNLNNATKLIGQYDIVADCSDNFETHYLTNDVCFYLDKPYVFASISQFEGQCSLFLGKKTPCYRCLFPLKPTSGVIPDCGEAGVLGVLPGLLGIIQANEVIKWALKTGDTLAGHLLTIDILKMKFQQFHLTPNPRCSLCVLNMPIELITGPEINDNQDADIILAAELRQKINSGENILLLDVRTVEEHNAYNIGGLLIPLSELPHRVTELDPNEPIIVYCQLGKRSFQGAEILVKSGFKSIRYLQGGISEWLK